MKRVILLLILLSITGCSTKTAFIYNQPTNNQEHTNGKIVAEILPLKDNRPFNKELDKIFESDPVEEIQNILIKELISTGLFKDIQLAENPKTTTADITIEPTLEWMNSLEMDYGKVKQGYDVAMQFGVLGVLAYGSATSTNFLGSTTIHVSILDHSSTRKIIDKDYKGKYEEKMSAMKSGSKEVKAKMVGNALKIALGKLKTDVIEALGQL